MGTIPDGVYTAAGNVLRLLSGPQKTIEQLKRLVAVIVEARRTQEEPNRIAEKIKEEAPELSSLVDALPKTRSELYNFILVILTAVSVLIAAAAVNKNSNPSDAEIEKMVEEAVEMAIQQSQKQPPTIEKKQPYIAPEKPGRNSPCTCGSGKKYKHCCGRLI
ncbi:MAG TPA: SEC-C metal-binding domain-containing protein [Gallionella sp.]|nr:SEC-C metal-binding domain-containing protein [Gallionella sp.]